MEGIVNSKTLWKRFWQYLVKLRDSEFVSKGSAQREMDKDIHSCIVYNSQTLETTSVSSNRIDK